MPPQGDCWPFIIMTQLALSITSGIPGTPGRPGVKGKGFANKLDSHQSFLQEALSGKSLINSGI